MLSGYRLEPLFYDEKFLAKFFFFFRMVLTHHHQDRFRLRHSIPKPLPSLDAFGAVALVAAGNGYSTKPAVGDAAAVAVGRPIHRPDADGE